MFKCGLTLSCPIPLGILFRQVKQRSRNVSEPRYELAIPTSHAEETTHCSNRFLSTIFRMLPRFDSFYSFRVGLDRVLSYHMAQELHFFLCKLALTQLHY